MLELWIVDLSEAQTDELLHEVRHLLPRELPEADLAPAPMLRPAARSKLRARAGAGICIVGPNLAGSPADLRAVRRLMPRMTLWAKLSPRQDCLAELKALADEGVEDVIPPDITPTEFMRKLLFRAEARPALVCVRNSAAELVSETE